MRKYYYIKVNKTIVNMTTMEEVIKQVKHGHYIIDFVYHLEDSDVEIIEIEREYFDTLMNVN